MRGGLYGPWRHGRLLLILCVLCVFPLPSPLLAQQEFRGAGKGSTPPMPLTGTVIDADHNAVDVYLRGGGGSGGTSQTDNSGLGTITGIGALFDTTPPAITDGNVGIPVMDSSRRLLINCGAGCSGSSFSDAAAFTFGTTAIGLSGFVVDDTATNTVAENSAGLARMNTNRIPYFLPTGTTGTALFPAAFASADNLVAQTATFLHGGMMAWDSGGSNWDRLLLTSGALHVTVQNASLAVTGTFWQATQPVSGSGNFTVIQPTGTNLHIVCDSGCTPGGSTADNSAFTFGTTALNPAGYVFDDTAPNAVTENNVATPRMSANRVPYGILRDAAGNERGANVNASNELLTSSAITTFPDNEPINVAQMNGVAVTMGNGAAGTGVQRVTLANDSTGIVGVNGTVAHDGVDAGAPVKIGARAVAHGSNPTGVAAADRTDLLANRAGIPFVIGGHPNAITVSAQVQDADGALTDQAIVSVAGGSKIAVTRLTVSCDGSTTAPTNIRVGFGAVNVPAAAHTGVAGILHEFDGVPAGGGFTIGDGSGLLGIGADGEDLRYTIEDPVGGNCTISATYFTIES